MKFAEKTKYFAVKFALLSSFLCILLIQNGCQQSSAVSTTTTTPTLTTPITSFCNVSLGLTKAQVVAALGSPEKVLTDGATGCQSYIYNSLQNISFDPTSEKVISILTSLNSDSLRGVARWQSESEVIATIGNYEEKDDGSTYYAWKYKQANVVVYFYYTTNVVHHFGIYDASSISSPPEYRY